MERDRLEPDMASQFFPFSFCPLNYSSINLATIFSDCGHVRELQAYLPLACDHQSNLTGKKE
jgi:hypothetical protein